MQTPAAKRTDNQWFSFLPAVHLQLLPPSNSFNSLQAHPLEYVCSSRRHSPSLIPCTNSSPNLSLIIPCVDDSHLPHHPTPITHHHGPTTTETPTPTATAKRMALQHAPECCATTATTCTYAYAICWQRRTDSKNVCPTLHHSA